MTLWLQKHHSLAIITLSPTALECATIHKNSPHDFAITAYECTLLEPGYFKDLILYHYSYIKNIILQFTITMHIKNIPSVITLDGTGFIEKIIGLVNEYPNMAHVADHPEAYTWDYMDLCIYQAKQYYYLCGLKQLLLFQYQLLSLSTNINCIKIIPHRIALLHACNFFAPKLTQTTPLHTHVALQNYIKFCIDQYETEHVLNHSNFPLKKEQLFSIIGSALAGFTQQEYYE